MTTDQVAFIQWCYKNVEERRNNAGFSGSMGDDGARDLENRTQAWDAGLRGVIPECLKKDHQKYLKETDPEWGQLKHLAEKFGIKVE